MKTLYAMCERFSDELSEANKRIEKNPKLNTGDIEYLSKLTDIIKDLKTIIAMEESDGEYSNYYPYSYDNYSYAGGRGGNVRRDNMGRYSRDNYSSERGGNYSGNYSRDHSETISKMRNLMNETSDERTRREMQRLISDMENN